MLKKILKIENARHLDYFTWMMFPYCNYNCNYCFQKEVYFGNEKINIEELKKRANKIYDYCNINNILKLDVFGGEPTILDYSEIIYIFEKFLNDKKITFGIITNFYRDIDYFFNLMKAFKNNCCFYITCSFHEEFTTQALFFKKILKLLKLAEEFPNSKIKIDAVINKNNENSIVGNSCSCRQYRGRSEGTCPHQCRRYRMHRRSLCGSPACPRLSQRASRLVYPCRYCNSRHSRLR